VAALHRGEREAIQLTMEQNADVLIMDEWKGRAIAHSRGLPLTGALGVLGDAYRKGLIDTPLQVLAEHAPTRISCQRPTGRQIPDSTPEPVCPV